MFTARELDIMQIEVEARLEKLMEEFVKSFMGERMNDAQVAGNLVANGRTDGEETYGGAGRQPVRDSQEVRGNDQFDIGR